ncbi:hypothetical protein WCLP8_2690010 [uncultured Gammaproteobacteria bacterium]
MARSPCSTARTMVVAAAAVMTLGHHRPAATMAKAAAAAQKAQGVAAAVAVFIVADQVLGLVAVAPQAAAGVVAAITMTSTTRFRSNLLAFSVSTVCPALHPWCVPDAPAIGSPVRRAASDSGVCGRHRRPAL